ncbi:MAG: BofC C-terminal domain-containing protein [Bacillus sp. (in: firmicutes)]
MHKLGTYIVLTMGILIGVTMLPEHDAYAETIRKLTFQRVYLDGEMSEESIIRETQTVKELIGEFADWQLIMQDEKNLVFQKYVDDISPLMKLNGYFGITEDGTLSIFNGKPTESDVIQSFFQIDVKMLETKKHLELVRGIPVRNKDHYRAVLEVFSLYME